MFEQNGSLTLLALLLIIISIFYSHYKNKEAHKARLKAHKIHMERVRQSNIYEIDQMNGRQFEEFLSYLYGFFGYHTEVTKGSGDYGADLVLKINNEKIVVQAKRYKNKVGIQSVQEVVAAKAYYNANHAWVVTNSYFTKPAYKLADANDVLLVNRDLLINLSAQVNRQNEQQHTNSEQNSY
ncbi:endonuclease [Bacillus wiedmannii]|nr:endonuclease [Bacillus wiedmannii]